MNKLNADENVSESAFEVRKTAKVSTSLSLVNGTAMDIDKLEQEIADLKKTLANPNTNKMTRDETKKKLDTATEKLEKKYVELGTSTLDTIKAIGKFVPIIGGWITEMVLLAKQLIKEGAGIITQHKKEIADAMEFMRQHTTSQSKSKLEEFTYFVYSLEEGIKEVKETVDKASVATKVDPIVIDLNVDELLETTDVKNGVYFDMDNKGFKEKTAWVSANDGLLVMDRNEDGLINSGAELFGDQNILMSGEVSSGGYISPEELDEDKNLKIDAQDSKFNQIKVWRDKNQDGISTKDELFGLEELSIKAIHLENNVVNETDGNGNTIDSQISDHKKPELDNLQISETIKSLPDIPSFGNVYSLRQAMALDQSGSLKNLVEAFVNDNNLINKISKNFFI